MVGSWNADLARLIPVIDRVETLDVPWLSPRAGADHPGYLWPRRPRAGAGRASTWPSTSSPTSAATCSSWPAAPPAAPASDRRGAARAADRPAAVRPVVSRRRQRPASGGADAAHPLAAGADEIVPAAGRSFRTGTRSVDNASASSALRHSSSTPVPEPRSLLAGPRRLGGGSSASTPLPARAVKEWPAERFAAAASRLSRTRSKATFVLLGSAAERSPRRGGHRERCRPTSVPCRSRRPRRRLWDLAAVLERHGAADRTGDTGPMHLAAAVGTPVVAIFGPSDPQRYAPLGAPSAVVHADLWCRPCNRVRRPPARCRSATPECLVGVSVDAVVKAARRLLAAGSARKQGGPHAVSSRWTTCRAEDMPALRQRVE